MVLLCKQGREPPIWSNLLLRKLAGRGLGRSHYKLIASLGFEPGFLTSRLHLLPPSHAGRVKIDNPHAGPWGGRDSWGVIKSSPLILKVGQACRAGSASGSTREGGSAFPEGCQDPKPPT